MMQNYPKLSWKSTAYVDSPARPASWRRRVCHFALCNPHLRFPSTRISKNRRLSASQTLLYTRLDGNASVKFKEWFSAVFSGMKSDVGDVFVSSGNPKGIESVSPGLADAERPTLGDFT